MPVPTVVTSPSTRPAAPSSSPPQTATELAGQTDCAPWTQRRAELELRRGREVETAAVGGDSVRVPWPFEPLSPRRRRQPSGSRQGIRRHVTDWSEPLRIRAGFLGPAVGRPPRSGWPTPEEAQPGLARTEFNIAGDVRRPPLRNRPRRLPGVDQRHRRRRPGPQAGLDAVPVADGARDHRRDQPAQARTQRHRDPVRRRLGHRAVRLPPSAAGLRRPAAVADQLVIDYADGRRPRCSPTAAGGPHRAELASGIYHGRGR